MTDPSKPDRRKSEEFRDAQGARAKAQWTPEARAAQSRLTREKMQAKEVRLRISDQIRAAAVRARETRLARLRDAWRRADKATRAVILAEVAAAIVGIER
jgi:hypothetical protein